MKKSNQNRYAGDIASSDTTYEYQYRTVSVDHFAELQEDIERLRREGMLCDSETFQGYLSEMKFDLPDDFANAKSVIILAAFIKPMMVNFHFNGACISAAMPPNYYDGGLTKEMIRDEIQRNVIAQDGYRAEKTGNHFHLKLLAVRSGLGQYGRNNICYVDGLGSFITLHAFLTDYPFETDHWGEMQMMRACTNCNICFKQCPGGAISKDRFLIDVKRCIPLYNEVEGVLPDWIPSNAHHAIMGCMKCQAPCPANRAPMKHMGQLEDITEEETRQFLGGNPDQSVILSVSQKLRLSYLVEYREMVEVVSRNIKALLPQMEQ